MTPAQRLGADDITTNDVVGSRGRRLVGPADDLSTTEVVDSRGRRRAATFHAQVSGYDNANRNANLSGNVNAKGKVNRGL